MNSILWMIFAACLAQQANAGYKVKISGIKSYSKGVTVTNNKPKRGDIKLTTDAERDGSTFEGLIVQGMTGVKAEIKGKVCDVNDETPEGVLGKILQLAVGIDSCPYPKGDFQINKAFSIDGNVFDQYIDPGKGVLGLQMKIFPEGSDGYVWWLIKVSPYDKEADQ